VFVRVVPRKQISENLGDSVGISQILKSIRHRIRQKWEFRLLELKIRNWYNNSKFESLYESLIQFSWPNYLIFWFLFDGFQKRPVTFLINETLSDRCSFNKQTSHIIKPTHIIVISIVFVSGYLSSMDELTVTTCVVGASLAVVGQGLGLLEVRARVAAAPEEKQMATPEDQAAMNQSHEEPSKTPPDLRAFLFVFRWVLLVPLFSPVSGDFRERLTNMHRHATENNVSMGLLLLANWIAHFRCESRGADCSASAATAAMFAYIHLGTRVLHLVIYALAIRQVHIFRKSSFCSFGVDHTVSVRCDENEACQSWSCSILQPIRDSAMIGGVSAQKYATSAVVPQCAHGSAAADVWRVPCSILQPYRALAFIATQVTMMQLLGGTISALSALPASASSDAATIANWSGAHAHDS
jgi:hypothetical protein